MKKEIRYLLISAASVVLFFWLERDVVKNYIYNCLLGRTGKGGGKDQATLLAFVCLLGSFLLMVVGAFNVRLVGSVLSCSFCLLCSNNK